MKTEDEMEGAKGQPHHRAARPGAVFSTMCFMFRSCELPYMIKIIFI
jgi:hypothetical protein